MALRKASVKISDKKNEFLTNSVENKKSYELFFNKSIFPFMKNRRQQILFVLIFAGSLVLSGCFSDSDSGSDLSYELPCVEPTETTVSGIKLLTVIAPSASRIAKNILHPEKNLAYCGFSYGSSVTITNVSGGTLYLDSLDVEVARTDGEDAFASHVVLDSAITLADSATVIVDAVGEIRADKMNLEFMQDLLEQTVANVKATPTLFLRFDDSHVCRESEGFVEKVLLAGGVFVFKTTSSIVVWIIENPKDFADTILLILSILLKCM